jgi:hypothetical protein
MFAAASIQAVCEKEGNNKRRGKNQVSAQLSAPFFSFVTLLFPFDLRWFLFVLFLL